MDKEEREKYIKELRLKISSLEEEKIRLTNIDLLDLWKEDKFDYDMPDDKDYEEVRLRKIEDIEEDLELQTSQLKYNLNYEEDEQEKIITFNSSKIKEHKRRLLNPTPPPNEETDELGRAVYDDDGFVIDYEIKEKEDNQTELERIKDCCKSNEHYNSKDYDDDEYDLSEDDEDYDC